jgi:hypothetical protein
MGDEAITFGEKELLEAAEGNATAFIMATISYLQEKNLSTQDWARFVGDLFAPSWDEVKHKGVDEIAREVALNVATTGGRILSVTGDKDGAEVVALWPANEEWLSDANLQRNDVQPLLEVFTPIAERLGVNVESQMEREGHTVIKLSR